MHMTTTQRILTPGRRVLIGRRGVVHFRPAPGFRSTASGLTCGQSYTGQAEETGKDLTCKNCAIRRGTIEVAMPETPEPVELVLDKALSSAATDLHEQMAAPEPTPVKQTTRMLKVMCPSCGYVVRTTAKWLKTGFPRCSDGEPMQLA